MLKALTWALRVVVALAFVWLLAPPDTAHAATFVVNSTVDLGDSRPGDGFCDTARRDDLTPQIPPSNICTLRAAIQEANFNTAADTIQFSIPGAGPHTIAPATILPTITNPVIIDGATQPGFAGAPVIEISGVNAPAPTPTGLAISASNSTVKGLAINRFGGVGLLLFAVAPGAGGNVVQGNFIGTDVTGLIARPNGLDGVRIDGQSNNTIGGTTAASRNVISGNTEFGVHILGDFVAATGNVVQGNFIGTNVTGASDLGNTLSGVHLHGASSNTIGGTQAGAGNLISGNDQHGISIHNSTSDNNVIQGNLIGTKVDGNTVLGNTLDGIQIDGLFNTQVRNNVVGGAQTGARNVISFNGGNGVSILGSGATGNMVQGNFIGINPEVSQARPNVSAGVRIENAPNNTIGGTTAAARNVISGNGSAGLFITGASASSNLIQGNFIGTNVAGTAAVGNVLGGVLINNGANNNTIGGTGAGAGNVISGNTTTGVTIQQATSSSNAFLGNFIGANAAGTGALGNQTSGIFIDGAPNTLIGGSGAGAGNVISANGLTGVTLSGAGATGTLIRGNFIGTNNTSTAALANVGDGVLISFGVLNVIGGTVAGARNVISGNTLSGIRISGAANGQNRVEGNFIGTDVNGAQAVPNQRAGVFIDGAGGNTIGGTGAGTRNIISGNNQEGVLISNGANANTVQGNFIGTDVNGTAALPNNQVDILSGVSIVGPATNNSIGGTQAGAGNVISGNRGTGISIARGQSGNATGNSVLGNFIGANANGTGALGNNGSGVSINGSSNNNTIGGTQAGAGNVISANGSTGISLSVDLGGTRPSNNTIQGNRIGTDVNGAADLGNLSEGIFVAEAPNNTIGGNAAGAGNVISGNDGDGILMSGTQTTGNSVLGNLIGTNASGTSALANSRNGVRIAGNAGSNTIGGAQVGQLNVIAFNGADGVFVESGGGNVISGNDIFSNTGLGIDLGPDGVTANDAGDGDSGANDLQNFPVLTSAMLNGGLTIQGTLNSVPLTTFTLEFFRNTSCDSSGFGEGQRFLNGSSAAVTTNTSGNVGFTVNLPLSLLTPGSFLTATATSTLGNTSEFAQCLVVVAQGVTVSGTVTLQGRTATFPTGVGHSIATVTLSPGGATANVAADGSFQFVSAGTFTFTASAPGYLSAQRLNVQVGNSAVALPAVQLRAGLVNNDTAVNILDISATVASFGSLLQNRVDAQGRFVDQNGDGAVNINDISAVVSNFGQSSPMPWP